MNNVSQLDPVKVAESLFMVLSKQQQIIPYKLNSTQQILMDVRHKGNRQIVLKARQQGISTCIENEFLARCLTRVGQHAVVMSHSVEETTELLERVRFVLDNIENNERIIPRKYDTKHELNFLQTQSTFKVKTAGAKISGRGPTINLLHCSEVAFWDNALKVMTAMFQTVPKTGIIYLESTANGAGGMFYDLCMGAMKGENEWVFNFFPWTLSSEYRTPLLPGEVITYTEEESLIAPVVWRGGVMEQLPRPTPEQIKWRRSKIAELAHNINQFKQEYPSTPEEAFLMTGTQYFDRASLLRYKPYVQKVTPIRGFLTRVGKQAQFIRSNEADFNMEIFDFPKTYHSYLITADISEGLPEVNGVKTSNTSINVFCRETKKQVARINGKYDGPASAEFIMLLGLMFRFPWVVVEANGPGISCLVILDQNGYPCIYKTKRIAQEGMPDTEKLGWVTDKSTRPLIMATLKQALINQTIDLQSKDTWNELMTFMYIVDEKSGKVEYKAAKNCYDDDVITLAMFAYLNDVVERQEPDDRSRFDLVREPYTRLNSKTGY